MINITHERFIPVQVLSGVLILGLGSCATLQTQENPAAEPSITQTVESDAASASQPFNVPVSSPSTSVEVPTETISVTIYTADSQCLELVPEQIQVAADQPLEHTIRQVLAAQNNADFDLAGYRVNINSATGVAIIDLRLSPNTDRFITSLSICEQFALFSSLRKTLIQNPDFGIKAVKFTERGEDIVL
ncbi:MAG: sporulation/spore germination protein [Cyanothece sp. SIO1E1]|nr:sporulation/spore germination protein [Cyanothece sp. SIO1E1]